MSFYKAKTEWELDDLLDQYFNIYYYKNSPEPQKGYYRNI